MAMSKREAELLLNQVVPPTAKELEAVREEEYDARLADMLCVRYGIPGSIRSMLKDRHVASTGEDPQITLHDWFCQFPTFPIYLRGVYKPRLNKSCPMPRFFTDFRGLPFVKEYIGLRSESRELAPYCGLVVRWPFFAAAGNLLDGFVLHNRPPDMTFPGVRLTWRGPGNGFLIWQPFLNLLDEIDASCPGKKWSPEPGELAGD